MRQEYGLTKSQLIKLMADTVTEQSGEKVSQAKMRIALDTVLNAIQQTIVEGKAVRIDGFGNFSPKVYKATTKRNPRNQSETVEVPERRYPKFKPCSAFKNAVKDAA